VIHTAYLRHLHIAPRKVRLIAHTIQRLPLAEAEAQLIVRNQRAAEPLLKLLRSAAAGAVAKNADRDRLMIAALRVDKGPILKRALPRAQGRATPIHKITSHVTLVLKETENRHPSRFVFVKKEKKKKKEDTKKTRADKKVANTGREKGSEEKETKGIAAREPGFFRKVFRRKSV
jgi:large subunit ribosomal protein L22